MKFKLTPIDLVQDIAKEDFEQNYLRARRPLILKNRSKNWPAHEKWNLDYMKTVVGDKTVPLYDSSKADPSKPINAPAAEMKFADYVDLIKSTVLISDKNNYSQMDKFRF
ncbi:cupin-like domain-containing protein [Pedobacter sp. N36a]|nr:cupin-like domain-containing protein [Pedobacter sp. N36a]